MTNEDGIFEKFTTIFCKNSKEVLNKSQGKN